MHRDILGFLFLRNGDIPDGVAVRGLEQTSEMVVSVQLQFATLRLFQNPLRQQPEKEGEETLSRVGCGSLRESQADRARRGCRQVDGVVCEAITVRRFLDASGERAAAVHFSTFHQSHLLPLFDPAVQFHSKRVHHPIERGHGGIAGPRLDVAQRVNCNTRDLAQCPLVYLERYSALLDQTTYLCGIHLNEY